MSHTMACCNPKISNTLPPVSDAETDAKTIWPFLLPKAVIILKDINETHQLEPCLKTPSISYAVTTLDTQRRWGRNHKLSHSPSPSCISRRGKPKICASADDQHICFCFLFSQKITSSTCSASEKISNLSICSNSCNFSWNPGLGSSCASQLQYMGY